MNKNTFLIITSIASPNRVLRTYAERCADLAVGFIVIGDTKSPPDFSLSHCDFWSIDRQRQLDFSLAKIIPERHYARKNIGYLLAIKSGAEIIVETDDDNFPVSAFWNERIAENRAHLLVGRGWVNIYEYFTADRIWPRGFPLEHLQDHNPSLDDVAIHDSFCPIQQGLADENPDVDAVYRLVMPLPVKFDASNKVALGVGSWCPFNSQNTTWFAPAFPLMYLPSHCSFRMTDIWRSFVAQRVAWTCGWNILFHNATVYQERNEHDLLRDFKDEIPGYLNNAQICRELKGLDLRGGPENILDNMVACYRKLVEDGHVGSDELPLLDSWISDLISLGVA